MRCQSRVPARLWGCVVVGSCGCGVPKGTGSPAASTARRSPAGSTPRAGRSPPWQTRGCISGSRGVAPQGSPTPPRRSEALSGAASAPPAMGAATSRGGRRQVSAPRTCATWGAGSERRGPKLARSHLPASQGCRQPCASPREGNDTNPTDPSGIS